MIYRILLQDENSSNFNYHLKSTGEIFEASDLGTLKAEYLDIIEIYPNRLVTPIKVLVVDNSNINITDPTS